MPKQITTYEDDELGLSPGWDEGLDQNIREMRRHAKITERENREMSKRLELLERKDTFAAVGIPRDKRGEVFAQVYNGPADAESVQTYWEELFGPLDEEQEPAGTTGSTSEAPSGTPAGSASTAAERRIARAGAAGTTTGQSGMWTSETSSGRCAASPLRRSSRCSERRRNRASSARTKSRGFTSPKTTDS